MKVTYGKTNVMFEIFESEMYKTYFEECMTVKATQQKMPLNNVSKHLRD